MADVYEMPVPKPPTDTELDELAMLSDAWLTRVDVPAGARQVIRVQATTIRKLRVALAQAQARAESVQAVANMRRDLEVASTTLDLAEQGIAAQGECEGSGCPPTERTPSTPDGRCPICRAWGPLDGEVMARHESPDPPLRSA
jgi:hypothetical protein